MTTYRLVASTYAYVFVYEPVPSTGNSLFLYITLESGRLEFGVRQLTNVKESHYLWTVLWAYDYFTAAEAVEDIQEHSGLLLPGVFFNTEPVQKVLDTLYKLKDAVGMS